jgi:hypothetical protein
MAQLLKHVECPCCGHRHHFCLPVGSLATDRTYEYVCPETGQKTLLRPSAGGENVAYYPQGAVELEAPAESAAEKVHGSQGGSQPGPTTYSPREGSFPSDQAGEPHLSAPVLTPESGAGEGLLQAALPEIQEVARKVGGMKNLSEIAGQLHQGGKEA